MTACNFENIHFCWTQNKITYAALRGHNCLCDGYELKTERSVFLSLWQIYLHLEQNHSIKLHANAHRTRNNQHVNLDVSCLSCLMRNMRIWASTPTTMSVESCMGWTCVQFKSINFKIRYRDTIRCRTRKLQFTSELFYGRLTTSKVETADNNAVSKINSDLFAAIRAQIIGIPCKFAVPPSVVWLRVARSIPLYRSMPVPLSACDAVS